MQKVAEAEAEGKRLRAEIKALDGDRKAIEKVAREKHGMIHEGETVYKVKRNRVTTHAPLRRRSFSDPANGTLRHHTTRIHTIVSCAAG